MEYTIVFIQYNGYQTFYECNNPKVTYDIFNNYAVVKEELVIDKYKPYTRLQKFPSLFPDMFRRIFYHPKIIQSILLLLHARSEKKYTPCVLELVYTNELWCFKKGSFYKPLFFENTDKRQDFQTNLKKFIDQGFPLTERDVIRHPYKEFKYIQLPNSFYFSKGIYIKKRFFEYIIDLLQTPSIIFENNEYEYEDDIDLTIENETTAKASIILDAYPLSTTVEENVSMEIEEVESEEGTEPKKEESINYIESKIPRSIYRMETQEDTRMVL